MNLTSQRSFVSPCFLSLVHFMPHEVSASDQVTPSQPRLAFKTHLPYISDIGSWGHQLNQIMSPSPLQLFFQLVYGRSILPMLPLMYYLTCFILILKPMESNLVLRFLVNGLVGSFGRGVRVSTRFFFYHA